MFVVTSVKEGNRTGEREGKGEGEGEWGAWAVGQFALGSQGVYS